MNTPEWIKPGAYGAVVGGIVVAVVGFTWGGWVTGGDAADRAETAAEQGRTDLAAAICVQDFIESDGARARLAELKEISSSTQRRTFIVEGGWPNMPDTDNAAVTRDAANLCARMLMELEPTELPVVENESVVEPGQVMEPDDEDTSNSE